MWISLFAIVTVIGIAMGIAAVIMGSIDEQAAPNYKKGRTRDVPRSGRRGAARRAVIF